MSRRNSWAEVWLHIPRRKLSFAPLRSIVLDLIMDYGAPLNV
jgi:hypothetical protein